MPTGLTGNLQSRALKGAVIVVTLLALFPAIAEAQTAVCRQLEAELASLDRPVMRAGRIANAERAQLARVNGNMAAMNCNRGFVLFGPALPPQCATLRSQAAALQGRIADIEAPRQVASGGDPGRRRQILAAINSYNCRAQQAAAVQPRPRSFLEALFGAPEEPRYATPPAQQGNMPPLVDGQPVDGNQPPLTKRAGGGNLAICVRTCDGFFFPVNYEGAGANDQYEEMCQASCPAAPTELYWMPAGGDLDQAANESGHNYTSLPNAFKYRQSYDPACTCKSREQSWASVLQRADSLMASRRSDITVTQESSNEMARGEPLRGLRGSRDRKQSGADVVTGSSPQAGAVQAPAPSEGDTREASGRDGEKRRIRKIAAPQNPSR